MVLTIKPTPKDYPDLFINDFAQNVYKELCSGSVPPNPAQDWHTWFSNKLGREHEKQLEENRKIVEKEYEIMMTKEYLKYRLRMILFSVFGALLFLLVSVLFTIDISIPNCAIKIL